MERNEMKCPACGNAMELAQKEEKIKFRDEDIGYAFEGFVCPKCGLETGTLEQTAAIQKKIADAYRSKTGLLTGAELVAGRKKLGLSQQALADRMKIGIASLKRWEGSIIQSRSMDQLLREALSGRICGDDPYTGNRPFSIPRVKIVLRFFEAKLGRNVLKKNDRMLYAAKYLWYSDMLAFRESGVGITGATYAALPYGPQMNNYKDLIGSILAADEGEAEPLSKKEEGIIERIALTFPRDAMVYQAAHREQVWKEKTAGSLIPYPDAARLTEI
jgi:putative zinc finger/helix-turn-helix YgiT family protein